MRVNFGFFPKTVKTAAQKMRVQIRKSGCNFSVNRVKWKKSVESTNRDVLFCLCLTKHSGFFHNARRKPAL